MTDFEELLKLVAMSSALFTKPYHPRELHLWQLRSSDFKVLLIEVKRLRTGSRVLLLVFLIINIWLRRNR